MYMTAKALQGASVEAIVGIRIVGNFCLLLTTFAVSRVLPPPIPIMTFVESSTKSFANFDISCSQHSPAKASILCCFLMLAQ